MEKVSKRAWAEFFEMERKIIRKEFLVRLYSTLLFGLLIGLTLDKLL
jgi:hypothetical protein